MNKASEDRDVLTIRMNPSTAAHQGTNVGTMVLSNCHLIRADGILLIRKP